MTARVLDVSQAAYHADPLPTPSLSSSIAHLLVSQSPKHAWLAHPRLGGGAPKRSRTLDTGSMAHELLLGCGKGIEVIDADDFKTKAAREARDAAYAVGKVPVLRDDLSDAQTVVEALKGQLLDLHINLDGDSEVPLTWEEETMHGGKVLCRGMLDHLILDAGVIYDVKTIRSANPKVCQKHMLEYGYDIQWAAYTSAVGKLRPALEGRTDFVFLFCELEPPYCITPVRPSGSMRQLGSSKWNRAVESWAFCLATGKWRGYAEGIIEIDAPEYAIANELGSAA
jgi:hypothetical protein